MSLMKLKGSPRLAWQQQQLKRVSKVSINIQQALVVAATARVAACHLHGIDTAPRKRLLIVSRPRSVAGLSPFLASLSLGLVLSCANITRMNETTSDLFSSVSLRSFPFL